MQFYIPSNIHVDTINLFSFIRIANDYSRMKILLSLSFQIVNKNQHWITYESTTNFTKCVSRSIYLMLPSFSFKSFRQKSSVLNHQIHLLFNIQPKSAKCFMTTTKIRLNSSTTTAWPTYAVDTGASHPRHSHQIASRMSNS